MKRPTLLLLITFLAFLSPTFVAYSQDVIDITKLSHKDDIGYAVSLFKDESRSLNIEEVENSIFIKHQSNVINLGYNNYNDWVF